MVALAEGVTPAMEDDIASKINCVDSELNAIINELLNNPDVEFSSQQRGENELSQEEKRSLANQLMHANKNLFLIKFGKHLNAKQLNCFLHFCNDSDKGVEMRSTLNRLQLQLDKGKVTKQTKNRRYQALQEKINESNYFSESEMMKRNPLLYNELVGQYLTEDERRIRDKATVQETLVQILMEGIERDDARELRRKQAEMEDNAMEEEDTSDEEEITNENKISSTSNTNFRSNTSSPEPEAGFSRWGESKELAEDRINHDEFYARSRTVEIAANQKALLREEFVSLMHQSFLNGRDDFDYETVDNNESYDNLEIMTQDEEDKYFDSEEANEMDTEENNSNSRVSSEDELEIFMNQLQKNNPAVCQLSEEFNKL